MKTLVRNCPSLFCSPDTQPLGAESHLEVLYEFPGAAATKYHKPSGFKQQKCIPSPSWRLEVGNQSVGRAAPPLKLLGEDPPLPLASGSPGCSLACGSITQISASVFTWPSSLCVCVFTWCSPVCVSHSPSSHKDTCHTGLGPTLMTAS